MNGIHRDVMGRPGSVVSPLQALIHCSAQRLLLSDKVAAAKFVTGRPVEDLPREQEVLESAVRLAVTCGADTELALIFFRDQIEASKLVQRGLIDLWETRPDLRPNEEPDLIAEVRPELDAINRAMVEQLARLFDEESIADSPGMEIAASLDMASYEMKLDGLHRRALAVAMRLLFW
jgi:chorismate mutase